jgi:hypothetical protein
MTSFVCSLRMLLTFLGLILQLASFALDSFLHFAMKFPLSFNMAIRDFFDLFCLQFNPSLNMKILKLELETQWQRPHQGCNRLTIKILHWLNSSYTDWHWWLLSSLSCLSSIWLRWLVTRGETSQSYMLHHFLYYFSGWMSYRLRWCEL